MQQHLKMNSESADKYYEFSLWVRFKSGDPEAFSEIYNTYADVLYNYGFHISDRQDLIEDAIQDLFVVLWQSRTNLSDTTSIKYYLFRSLRRHIVKLMQKDGRFESFDNASFPEILSAIPSIELQIISEENDEKLWKELKIALMDLNPRQLEAIRLHFYEGFDLRTVAAIMDMKEQSVRNLLHRSFHKLRQKMLLFPLLVALLQ